MDAEKLQYDLLSKEFEAFNAMRIGNVIYDLNYRTEVGKNCWMKFRFIT